MQIFTAFRNYLKPSGTPINKLDRPLLLQFSDGCVDIPWHNISSKIKVEKVVKSNSIYHLHNMAM